MDNTQHVWRMTGRKQGCYTTGYDAGSSDKYQRALQKIVEAMSREGSKPSGADSTGETGADVCEARTPWRGQSIGVTPR